MRVADQLEKDDALRRQVQVGDDLPDVVFTFAVIVLIALVAFLVPVFEGGSRSSAASCRRSRRSWSACPTS